MDVNKLKEKYPKETVARIVDIVNLINKLPISNNKERDELFQFMVREHFTDNPDERWVDDTEKKKDDITTE